MLLYDSSNVTRFLDYGIMLPISPSRAESVFAYLAKNYPDGTRGATFPYPGPVYDMSAALSCLGISDRADSLITRQDLERIHSPSYIASLYDEGETKGGISPLEQALLNSYELIGRDGKPYRYEPERAVKPLSQMFDSIRGQIAASYLCCRLALTEGPGFCYHLGGGMHHARYDTGSGFCLLNDVAVAAAKIVCDPGEFFPGGKKASLVWIVDMDAHKGDGSAELFSFAKERGLLASGPNENKACILTLSIHMAKGWPLDAESLACACEGRAPLVPSDIDIGIDAGEEKFYTPRLKEGMTALEKLSAGQKPDLVIVVDGADPYEHDGLASSALLKLSLEQCLERDLFVYRYCTNRSIPSAWIMAGGYGERAWEPPALFLEKIR